MNSWPSWHADITDARLDGPLAPGASFDWTSFGFSVTSTVYDLAERARVLWGGTSGGITGVHEWLSEETLDGVHVTTSESFAGEPVQADTTGMQKLLDASLAAWLNALKAAGESPADDECRGDARGDDPLVSPNAGLEINVTLRRRP